ncbi:hypothetical protein MPC4_40019 [Methylocella tundrae]|uniref:Uncharacterized protein n=1 Tax=Methylocella tundrae TaxID=227605 RepID=A0A8B6M995_METTU|nr:hypothetical protein MPC1_6840001 [Methylocella tundrae]VTZ51422.1 hypothetical protein MPC4_40019 [Methylocella tundrae]
MRVAELSSIHPKIARSTKGLRLRGLFG